MSGAPAIIQGFLLKKAMNSGKNWKRRYFTLTMSGDLAYSEKKGAPPKNTIKITKTTQIEVLKELGEEGICITGPGHNPLYLQADSPEVAEGWIQALNIVKNGTAARGGAAAAKDDVAAKKGEDLRAAFANKDALGSGRNLRKGGTLQRKDKADSLPKNAKGKQAPAPPPKSMAEMSPRRSAGRGARAAAAAAADDGDEDEDDGPRAAPPPPAAVDSSDDEEAPPSSGGGSQFPDGFLMRIGDKDYFVDAQGWEYYESRKDFLAGKKPKGTAVLSILV